MYTEREIALELGDVRILNLDKYYQNQSIGVDNRDSYFSSRLESYKVKFWGNYYAFSNRKHLRVAADEFKLIQGYKKMILTKYIANLEMKDIPAGSVGYYLGKRYTKVKDVNQSLEFYGLSLEKSDPKLADFFIVGDNLTSKDIELNKNLSKPMVMDDELRVDHHFSVLGKGTIDKIDSDKLVPLFTKISYSNLKLICTLIKNAKRDSLTNIDKYRLLRLYIKVFNTTTFDLKNKEHVDLSDTTQKFVIPFHRYYITNAFMNSSQCELTTSNKVSEYKDIGDLVVGSSHWDGEPPHWYLPRFEDYDEVVFKDIEDDTSSSILPKYGQLAAHTTYSSNVNLNNPKFELCVIEISNVEHKTKLKYQILVDKDNKSLTLLDSLCAKNYTISQEYFLNVVYYDSSMISTEKARDSQRLTFERMKTLFVGLLDTVSRDKSIFESRNSVSTLIATRMRESSKYKELIIELEDESVKGSITSEKGFRLRELVRESTIKQLNYLNN